MIRFLRKGWIVFSEQELDWEIACLFGGLNKCCIVVVYSECIMCAGRSTNPFQVQLAKSTAEGE